jgi:hypothetical protein
VWGWFLVCTDHGRGYGSQIAEFGIADHCGRQGAFRGKGMAASEPGDVPVPPTGNQPKPVKPETIPMTRATTLETTGKRRAHPEI